MRIGIFSDRYLPQTDGVSYSIETFRIELEKLGHDVYVFAPRPSWRYKDPSKKIIRFAAVKGLFFEDYLTSFFFPPQAIRQIQKLNLDVVHFQTTGQIGLLGAYYALHSDKPLATTYHTDLFEYVKHYPTVLPGAIALSLLTPIITGGGMALYREAVSSITPERSVDKWNQKIVVRGITLLHNYCDLVIAPSTKISQQLKRWHTKSPIEILPTGVDKIPYSRDQAAAFRRRQGIANSDLVVLFVGRIGTEKNIGLLIHSFELVAARVPNSRLVIVGSGDDLENFKQQSQNTDCAQRIIFTGRVDRHKLGEIYGASDLLAFPSLADTQGMVVNEATRAGLPIVMVDKDISEVVKQGINGFFARNSARDFASKITRILQDDALRERMSKASVELASEYSASNQAAKLLRLYQETIENHVAREQKTRSREFGVKKTLLP
jgi:1,2-diacylglycerol 3-alpha-glucosyltransferase